MTERVKPSLDSYLGQTVTVVIDRPLGSTHPSHPETVYPVNYGEIPGTVSGDGMPIDAYVIGVDRPLAEFTGIVVGVVIRRNDVEDKLVVAASGEWDEATIRDAVGFQERYFDTVLSLSSLS